MINFAQINLCRKQATHDVARARGDQHSLPHQGCVMHTLTYCSTIVPVKIKSELKWELHPSS